MNWTVTVTVNTMSASNCAACEGSQKALAQYQGGWAPHQLIFLQVVSNAQSKKKVNAQLISITTLSSDMFLALGVKAYFLWELASESPWCNESSNWLATQSNSTLTNLIVKKMTLDAKSFFSHLAQSRFQSGSPLCKLCSGESLRWSATSGMSLKDLSCTPSM